MKTIKIEIRYTAAGDATPYLRALVITQDVPVITLGPCTDLILAIPGIDQNWSWPILVPGVWPTPVAEGEVVALALAQEREARLTAAAEREMQIRAACQELVTWAREALAQESAAAVVSPPYPGIDGCPRVAHRALYESYDLQSRDTLVEILGEPVAVEVEAVCVELTRQTQIAQKERKEAEDQAATLRRAEGKRQAEAEAEAEAARNAEIAAWAAEHGSARLQGLIALERSGWPLYLHERLAVDYPGAELDNDGRDVDCVSPSEAAVQLAREVAGRMVALGAAESVEVALRDHLEVKFIEYEDTQVEYVFWGGYRPGADPSWKEKTIRWEGEKTRRYSDSDGDDD
ncbi:MAG: hypothetical protein A2Y61_00345 [Chloroflexi bacterium RBG_13_60_13]|nr:MAG: hypothetical protein A2Y61_00345 [Chloroflexi bacterium RBG_13_60_13]